MILRQKMFSMGIILQLLTPLFIGGMAYAEGGVVACDGATGDDSRVCLQAPQGIIAKSAKAKSFVTTLNWLMMVGSILVCVMSLLKVSSRLSDDQYKEAIGPGMAAGVAALSTYIAYQMIS